MAIYQNGKEITPKLNGKNLSRVMYNGKKIWPTVVLPDGYIRLEATNTGVVSSSNNIFRTIKDNKDIRNYIFNQLLLVEQVGDISIDEDGFKTITVNELNQTNKKRIDGSTPTNNVFILTPSFYHNHMSNKNSETGYFRIDYSAKENKEEYITDRYYNRLVGVYPATLKDDKLYSLPNSLPVIGYDHNQLKTFAQNNKLTLVDYLTYCMFKELYLLKYTDMNIANTIGSGKIESYLDLTGSVDNLGMTDSVPNNNTTVNNFCGVEALWGGYPEFAYRTSGYFNDTNCYLSYYKFDKLGDYTSNTVYTGGTKPTTLQGRIKQLSDEYIYCVLDQNINENNNFSSIQYYNNIGSVSGQDTFLLQGGNLSATSGENYDSGLFYASFNNNADTLYYKGGRVEFMGRIIVNRADGTVNKYNFD